MATKTQLRLRRWLKRLAWTAAVFVVLLTGFVVWALTTCFAEPPELAGRPAILDAKLENGAAGRTHLGKSWFEKLDGRSLLYLEGDPFTLGYSNATLTAEFLTAQELTLMDTVRTFLPGTISFYGAALLVLVHNRNLPDYVAEDHKLEIYGLAYDRGDGTDPYPEFGSRYHRILNYHAAHDISHWIFDQPVIGCTSFAASGDRTRDGHLIVGRNFDWESGGHFDTRKVIALYRPTKGHAFLSVSWPGMAGAVTGLNDAKIFCSINGAHTEHMGLGVGRPVSLVVRDILQHATTLGDAAERVRRAPVFVADSFLIADGKTGEAIVVEKTPNTCAVRRMQAGLIVQANHFETPELEKDRGNLQYMRDGTSVHRRARLVELLQRHDGKLGVSAAVEILRDRRGPGDAPRALGHRSTINAMIATHSVVADVTQGVLWVSQGRHQLGAYNSYTIDRFGLPPWDQIDRTPLPKDLVLTDGSFERLTRFRALIEAIDLDHPFDPDSRKKITAAAELNPLAPQILALEARTLEHDGKWDAALAKYRATLAAHPPFRKDRDAIARAIRSLEAALSRQRPDDRRH